MNLIETLVKDGVFHSAPAPNMIVATLESHCNLSCQHCFWSHEIKDRGNNDWDSQLSQIADWDASLIYAGRILTRRGEQFLLAFNERTGNTFDIVDNGYTILNFPSLFVLYGQINISVDGDEKDHDIQRNKSGSWRKAWQAIDKLKNIGYDPICSSVVSPLNIERWHRFEDRILREDVPLSCTPVWGMKETLKRGMPCFTASELRSAFETLITGVPKLLKFYDPTQVAELMPLLKRYDWTVDGDNLTTRLTNGTLLLYQPLCVSVLVERQLDWAGRFHMSQDLSADFYNSLPTTKNVLESANRLAVRERKSVCELLAIEHE